MYNAKIYDKIQKEILAYLHSLQKGEPMGRFHITGSGAVYEIEELVKKIYSSNYALSFSSATNALSCIALSLELTSRDEVITAPYNWGSSIAGLIKLTPTKIIIADGDKNGNISPTSIRKKITERTKAIWACDWNGKAHNMDKIRSICDQYKLAYISDASQSFGVKFKGNPASSLADVWVVGFGSGKKVDVGEGAMVLTNNRLWHEKMLIYHHPERQMAEISLNESSEFYPINGRMSPLSAIVLKNYLKNMLGIL